MVDNLSQRERSALMARIRDKNTKPEMAVRRMVHGMGFRFRLHRRDLPGTPDLVFPMHRKVIFVHGCFWHRHVGCKRTTTPRSNEVFWQRKFDANVARDRNKISELKRNGWLSLVIWECETEEANKLERKLRQFLQGAHRGR